MKRVFVLLLCCFFTCFVQAQEIGVLKYGGGGDWYSNPTALPNLIKFCNEHIKTRINPEPVTVEASDVDLFSYPLIHMTGHGNVFFSEEDASQLRKYLLGGGFLHIDDNYGMNEYIQKEIKKIFPNQELKELGANHSIFSSAYEFPKGLPKIHEHDGKKTASFWNF